MTQATHCNPTASELRILSNKNDYYVFHYLYLVKTPHTLSGHSTILYLKKLYRSVLLLAPLQAHFSEFKTAKIFLVHCQCNGIKMSNAYNNKVKPNNIASFWN